MPATLATTNDPRPRVAVLDPPALAGQATRIYMLATALAAAAFAALAIDIPASEFCRSLVHDGPGDFHKALQLFEAFAHGVGIAIIVAIIAALDGWKNAVRIAACAYGAGLANLLVKLSIGRSRPQVFWRMGEWPEQVSETFVGLVLFGDSSQAMSRGIQSFPSGHAATAAAFAAALAWHYPRGRWAFAIIAALTMLQRVESGAHFPSDVFAGAALGVLITGIGCDKRLLGQLIK